MNDNGGSLDTKRNEDHDIPNSLRVDIMELEHFPDVEEAFLDYAR
jgi:hypothetical protein